MSPHGEVKRCGYRIGSPVTMSLAGAILPVKCKLVRGRGPRQEVEIVSAHLYQPSKEQRGMAEIATLTIGGIVLAMAIAMAYMAIYLFGNSGTH